MYEVYIVAHLASSKVYVGITSKTVIHRWRQHVNSKRNDYFHNAIRKYGRDAFGILVVSVVETEAEAEQLERSWIADLRSDKACFGYNHTPGGSIAGNHTKESKAKISKALEGNQYRTGIPHSEEIKKQIAESGKRAYAEGRHVKTGGMKKGTKLGPMSEEDKQKRSEGVKRARANKFWSSGRKKMNPPASPDIQPV